MTARPPADVRVPKGKSTCDTPEKPSPRCWRAGYRYAWDLNDSSQYQEHRGLLEVTFRYLPVARFVFINRSRLDLRDVNGEGPWRYRNRSRLERDFRLGSRVATPYVMAEFFRDSRYDEWNRQRYFVGIEWPIGRTSVLDSYYCRQDDSRSSVAHVNAVGLALSFYFPERGAGGVPTPTDRGPLAR